jgi:ribosome-binding protein aMBF1 (putative translation factor)
MATGLFSEQLREAINDSGMSRYRLSQRTGVSQVVLSRFVRGEAGMSLATIDVLVEALGLELRPIRKGKDHA